MHSREKVKHGMFKGFKKLAGRKPVNSWSKAMSQSKVDHNTLSLVSQVSSLTPARLNDLQSVLKAHPVVNKNKQTQAEVPQSTARSSADKQPSNFNVKLDTDAQLDLQSAKILLSNDVAYADAFLIREIESKYMDLQKVVKKVPKDFAAEILTVSDQLMKLRRSMIDHIRQSKAKDSGEEIHRHGGTSSAKSSSVISQSDYDRGSSQGDVSQNSVYTSSPVQQLGASGDGKSNGHPFVHSPNPSKHNFSFAQASQGVGRPTKQSDLPTFDGLASNWLEFKQEFVALVFSNPFNCPLTAKRLLREAVPKLHKMTVQCSADVHQALACLDQRFVKDDVIRSEIRVQTTNIKTLTDHPSLNDLESFRDHVLNARRQVEPYGSILAEHVHNKLASLKLGRLYDAYMNKDKSKNLDHLVHFLEKQIEKERRKAEHAADNAPSTPSSTSRPKPQPYATLAATSNSSQVEKCFFCDQNHLRKDCTSARRDRLSALKRQGRCFGCFRILSQLEANHRSLCRVQCFKCKREHTHSLVCRCQEESGGTQNSSSGPGNATPQSSTAGGQASQNPTQTTLLTSTSGEPSCQLSGGGCESPVYLPTMTVSVENSLTGDCENGRLLVDTGATKSYITEGLVAKLGLPTKKIPSFRTSVFGGKQSQVVIEKVASLRVRSLLRPNIYADVSMAVVPGALSGKLPLPSKELREWGEKRHIRLSEPKDDGEMKDIDMIIGEDVAVDHFALDYGRAHRPCKGVMFYPSKFGWFLRGASGGASIQASAYPVVSFIATSQQTEPVLIGDVNFTPGPCACQDLTKLFLDPLTDPESSELTDKFHKQYFDKLELDPVDKRFFAGVPWRSSERPSNNYSAVRGQTMALTHRLRRAGTLDEYSSVVNELVSNGHAELLPEDVDFSEGHLIPHFPVRKDSSDTTPVRMVFNPSKAKQGESSLNDCIYKGIWQQSKLAEIIIRFRTSPLAVLVDLKKAFLQIRIRQEDRRYLRFLWLHNGKLRVFQMTSLLFGASSSPYILHAAIRKLFELRAPDLLPQLHNIYMDDALLTAESVEQLKQLIIRASDVLGEASFVLHKWTATPELSKLLGIESKTGLGNVLGTVWDLTKDQIRFSIPQLSARFFTRRVVSSLFARVFDPLGLLGPNQTRLKLLLRDIMESCRDWDKPLNDHFRVQVEEILNDFNYLGEITFPRNIRPNGGYELWSFGDASKFAYGICVYVHDLETKSSQLLLSRGKLPSAKAKCTIPQLELGAALLLSRTFSVVIRCLSPAPVRVRHFTDSMVTLHRILGDTNAQDQYVSGRVKEITDRTSKKDWQYIPTAHNPADIISRGMSLQLLQKKSLWFEGPPVEVIQESEEKVLHSTNVIGISTVDGEPVTQSDIMERLVSKLSFSALRGLVRGLMNHMSLYVDSQKRLQEGGAPLHLSELADIRTWKAIQMVVLKIELPYIKRQEKPPTESPLKGNFFVDDYGLVRNRRRMDYADVEYEIKFPLVLTDHAATRQYIKHVHETKASHGGAPTTEHHVRLYVFLPNMSRIVRSVLKDCKTCRRYRTGKPFVANAPPLPSDRSTSGFAFKAIGIDLFGPILSKKKSDTKFYGVIFVCARSRAVHLEVIDSRETRAIMDAFHRFTGIYGIPELIRSDNELGFHKMAKTIKAVHERFTQELKRWKEKLGPGIEWIFQPPSAPWWGAYWERLIGSVKRAICQIRLNECTTLSQLETLFRQVQGFINSRPLLTKSGAFPLTPAHLVFGRALDFLPPVKFPIRSKDEALVEYTLLQQSLDAFWQLFLSEYLTQLRDHQLDPTEAPKLNELVIIADDNQPRYRWEMGTISRLPPSRDDNTRVAEVRLLHGNITRTRVIQRLIPVERDLLGEDVVGRVPDRNLSRENMDERSHFVPSHNSVDETFDSTTEQSDNDVDESSNHSDSDSPFEVELEPDDVVRSMVLRSGRIIRSNKAKEIERTAESIKGAAAESDRQF